MLVEGDEWAHSIAWLPIPQAEPQLGQQLPSPHGAPQSAHPPGRKRLPRKGFRTSSPELQAASFAYDWPDEMPADGELTATPGRRPELLIWADNAHTRWQLTASLPTVVGGGHLFGRLRALLPGGVLGGEAISRRSDGLCDGLRMPFLPGGGGVSAPVAV